MSQIVGKEEVYLMLTKTRLSSKNAEYVLGGGWRNLKIKIIKKEKSIKNSCRVGGEHQNNGKQEGCDMFPSGFTLRQGRVLGKRGSAMLVGG